jgi:hypothetical protein
MPYFAKKLKIVPVCQFKEIHHIITNHATDIKLPLFDSSELPVVFPFVTDLYHTAF